MAAKRYLILGAGAAGLSLCLALLERGVRDEILILDRKSEFTDDRTWCFWNTAGLMPFSSLISHCWHRWEVRDNDGHAAVQRSSSRGYACLRGLDFYAHVSEVICRHPNVLLKLGCAADQCQPHAHGVSVRTASETIDADYVFDSRPRPVPDGGITLSQRFFGQVVRTETSCFDPSVCTLMDFELSQKRGLHFMYVLPFSPTEALVENTYIQDSSSDPLTPALHRAEIADYLEKQSAFRVLREEAGSIPMTTQVYSKREGRVFFIGTSGGCTKASSGYTFTRIQAQARQIASAVAAGTLNTFQETPAPFRYRFFDAVFLQAIHNHPEAFPGYFHRLFARVPPDALTAFLSETSTWRSDLQIIRSLPVRPFLIAALKSAPYWLRRQPPMPCAPR